MVKTNWIAIAMSWWDLRIKISFSSDKIVYLALQRLLVQHPKTKNGLERNTWFFIAAHNIIVEITE